MLNAKLSDKYPETPLTSHIISWTTNFVNPRLSERFNGQIQVTPFEIARTDQGWSAGNNGGSNARVPSALHVKILILKWG